MASSPEYGSQGWRFSDTLRLLSRQHEGVAEGLKGIQDEVHGLRGEVHTINETLARLEARLPHPPTVARPPDYMPTDTPTPTPRESQELVPGVAQPLPPPSAASPDRPAAPLPAATPVSAPPPESRTPTGKAAADTPPVPARRTPPEKRRPRTPVPSSGAPESPPVAEADTRHEWRGRLGRNPIFRTGEGDTDFEALFPFAYDVNGETRWYQVRFTGEYARRLQQQGFGQGDGIVLAGYDKSFDATKADGTVTRLDRINGVNAKLIQKSRRKQGSDVSR